MKAAGVLAISVCVNLGLIAALAHFSSPPAELSADADSKTVTVTKTQVVNRVSSQIITNQAKASFSWRSIESPEYREYIVKLRSIECPEETIRDIILADIDKLYAPRFAALRPKEQRDYKFWKRNTNWQRPNPELRKQYKALGEEKDALIKDLLGVDAKTARDDFNWWEDQQKQLLSFLSEDKQEQARKIREKYDDERQNVYARAQSFFDQEDQADIKKIHKKELADMAAFMTPEELFEYDIRTSDTSRNLSYQIGKMNPTEEEFRNIFQLRSAAEDYANPTEDQYQDKDFMSKKRAADKQSQDQLKAYLGDDRYKEYQRAQDYSYQSLVDMSQILGFDKAAASSVYDMKSSAEDAANNVRLDKTLSNEDRTAKLKAIRSETEKAIKDAIGEKGYKAYRRQGGYWLGNIYNN